MNDDLKERAKLAGVILLCIAGYITVAVITAWFHGWDGL